MFTPKSYQFGAVEIHTLHFGEFEPNDYLHILNENEKKRVEGFLLAKRKREFIATRLIKEEILPNTTILYTQMGSPFVENGPFISISHAPGVAGIAICKDFRIGFDLEPIREKVQRIKHKFLHKQEYLDCDTEDTETLIKIWSGKEALFKLACREEVIFADDLQLKPIDSDHWTGSIHQPEGWIEAKMRIFTQNELVISVNTSDVQRA